MPLFYEDQDIRVFKAPCGPFDNNAYLIVCPKTSESIIIDAPMGPGELLQDAKNTQVNAILITHNHQDHLAGLKEIKEATGAPVGIHGEDAGALQERPGFLVKDGDTIRAGSVELRAIHTPGHTPGSVCYITGKHLFSGDTLFPGGPGRSNSPQTLQQTIESITGKLYPHPDDTHVLPGHGADTTLGVSKEEYSVFAQKSHPPDLHGDVLWLES
ncbi:MAG: MBL fold metallo-hydrolase [Chloroflexi bacterium]|nr:MBL fold metallo-hydrolase [Chloroflexota bacterium]